MSRLKKIVLNAAGLHTGGGVQVATSFFDELTKIGIGDLSVSVLASTEVHRNLVDLGTDTSVFSGYRVLDVFGVKAFFSGISQYFRGADGVFTIFGPTYCFIPARVKIVGFAQAWVLYPDNDVYPLLDWRQRVLLKLKFALQKIMFRYADIYVVELEHVKERLVFLGVAKADDVRVVHNTLPEIFANPDQWLPLRVALPNRPGAPRIGFLTRDYPHKNLDILPAVKRELQVTHDMDIDFLVTLNDAEWLARDEEFRLSMVNVGPLGMAECPVFYQSIDAVVFPSLLECFSVTPLESMAMGKALFASDRQFVKDVCKDFAFYFDPLDAKSIAASIADYFVNRQDYVDRLAAAESYARNFSTARIRAQSYLKIIRDSI